MSYWYYTKDLIYKLLGRHCLWFTFLTFVFIAIDQFCLINFFIILLVTIAVLFSFLSTIIIVILVLYLWIIYFFKVYQVILFTKNYIFF